MKLTFEGKILKDIIQEMEDVLAVFAIRKVEAATPPGLEQPVVPKAIDLEAVVQKAKAYMEAPFIVDKPVVKPVEKRVRTEKQLANDEKMRVVALARVAAKRAAKADKLQQDVQAAERRIAAKNERPSEAMKKLVKEFVEEEVAETPDPFVQEPEIDPAEMVKLREKTFEELRTAYANGHQQEVMELLSRFGNGAKTFRELPPESFVPIRKAIDLGALE